MRGLVLGTVLSILLLNGSFTFAGPAEDRAAFREFFEKRFRNIPIDAHVDGAYALDAAKREQWLSMEDFPPYEIAVDDGQILFEEEVFADGSTYADCFADDGAVRQHYPQYDAGRQTVVTLEMAINDCREAAGESPLTYDSEEIIALSAYMAWVSRDNLFDVKVPPEAEATLRKTLESLAPIRTA